MTLQIFSTGGTIDKVYFDAKSTYEVGEPLVVDILRSAGVSFEVRAESLMHKDSLEMTDADRALVAERIRAGGARHVLVTHGTDTMAETAQAVEAALGEPPTQTVVFVGSLTPARFKQSDAEFNVGVAVAAVQTLPPGVYVAMNGRVFAARGVAKNRERNRFEGEPVPPPATTEGVGNAVGGS